MKPDEIHLNDWLRMIFGEVPPEFYIELAVRAAFVYLLLLVSMRALGKRMAGQLSRLDLTAMVALASSIGVAMLSPVNGMLPPLIIAIIIVSISRLISYVSMKSEKFEKFTQGELDTLIENGVMYVATMKKVRVTRERLFAQLRSLQIEQLGKVNRLYMEADGNFSIIINEKAKPGLLVLPDWDDEFVTATLNKTDITICRECGAEQTQRDKKNGTEIFCHNCGARDWTKAVEKK